MTAKEGQTVSNFYSKIIENWTLKIQTGNRHNKIKIPHQPHYHRFKGMERKSILNPTPSITGSKTVNNLGVYQASHKCSSSLYGCACEHLYPCFPLLLACTLHTCWNSSFPPCCFAPHVQIFCQQILMQLHAIEVPSTMSIKMYLKHQKPLHCSQSHSKNTFWIV